MEDNQDKLIYKRLIGGLDLSNNLSDVDKGDFIDGFDIVDKSPKTINEDNLLQPCSNTKLAYDLGNLGDVSTKQYRVTFDLTDLADCDLLFNISLRGFYSGSITVPYTNGDNAATTLTNIEAEFLANTLLNGTLIDSVLVSGFNLVIDIQMDYFAYCQHFLTVTNSLGDSYKTECLIEAVSKDFVSAINPICFANINNDQQIFGTSNVNKPEILNATITAASNDYIYITFATDPLINNEVEFYIYPESSTSGVSGLCTITSAGLGVYKIVSSLNPFASTSAIPSTPYKAVRYYRTFSVIGYAQKNDILDEWTYTELLRSTNLNFRPYKQIQGALDITSNGIIYDWTDFLNPLRRLIYKGDIVANGFLTVYNSEAFYDLDTIEEESRLQLGVNTAKATIQVATAEIAGGKLGYVIGAKREACYTVFVRFKTNDGAWTTYSKASNVLWLRSSDVRDHNYGNNSGRVLQITIEQIPFEIYDYVQIGIIEFTEESWKGYSLPEVEINGQETMYIADDGFNPSSYIDFNAANTLLEQIPFVFENAKSILAYNNYRLAANANLYQQYDLTDWAQDIVLTARKKEVYIAPESQLINASLTNANIFAGINDYSRCSNQYMSNMPYDKYRYCVYIDWKNGMPTSTYWMDDVDFDQTVTGFTNSPTVYSAGDIFYNQLYVEATNINMNYVLPDGKLLKEVVKDIRFGRALCNSQVYTTGFGMNVFENPLGGTDYVSGFFDGTNVKVDTKLALFSPDFQNTSTPFSYESGDILKTRLATRDSVDGAAANPVVTFVNRFLSATTSSVAISNLENATAETNSSFALLGYNTGSGLINIRPSAVIESAAFEIDASTLLTGHLFYYIKPYGSSGAYPLPPQQTRFFVVPQDKWYDESTHDSSTVYEIYGGDAFPTLSAYKEAENTDDLTIANTVLLFWTYNRTNTGLRSGSFPYVSLETYRDNYFFTTTVLEQFPFDQYDYNNCFTPRYTFQNTVAFNPDLPQFLNQFSTLYYSNPSFGSNLSGGNRIWLPLDMKPLETKYGAITHIDVLLGQTGTNILIVWQERRVTAQYFDNTANLKSNTGELLMGNGVILGREGQNFTEFGCEHKWTVVKGQTITGKDVAYWLCLRKTAIMRFGADGTSNIIGNIAPLIENKAILGLFNGFNADDEPAFFNGIHATWDNKRMEYILTLRLMPKTLTWAERAEKGEFKADPTLKWGFEQFPVIYKSLINNNLTTPPNANWQTISGYDSEYFEILTIIWNERDNVFKVYRTYSPKIYGQFNDNYVSSHPTQGNLIYEHNSLKNEALYYEVETTTSVTATTEPDTFRINGTNIQSSFPSPFEPYDRQKYIVKIDGKNYEIVGTGTNYLQMANVDDDDIFPQTTIPNFSYSTVNSQDPYITGVLNENKPKFVQYSQVSIQSDTPIKEIKMTAGLNSILTPEVETTFNPKTKDYYQGMSNDQVTTPSNTQNSFLEGYRAKIKNIWRWGKKNRIEAIIVNYINVDKNI